MNRIILIALLIFFTSDVSAQLSLKANYTYSNEYTYSTKESFNVNEKIYTFIGIRNTTVNDIKVNLIINDFEGNFISNFNVMDSLPNHRIDDILVKQYDNYFVILGKLTNVFNLDERIIYTVCDLNGNVVISNIIEGYNTVLRFQDIKIDNNLLLFLGHYRRSSSMNYHLLNLKHNLITNNISIDSNYIREPNYDIYFIKDSTRIIRFEVKQFNNDHKVYFKHVLLDNDLTALDSVLDTSKFVLSTGTQLTNIVYNSIGNNIEIKGQFSNVLGTSIGKENFDFMLKVFNTNTFKYLVNINFYKPGDDYQTISTNSLRYSYSNDTCFTIHRFINDNNHFEFILSKFINDHRILNTSFVSDMSTDVSMSIHIRDIQTDKVNNNITVFNANTYGDIYLHRFNSNLTPMSKYTLNVRDSFDRYLYYVNAYTNNNFLLYGIKIKNGTNKTTYNTSFYESIYTYHSIDKLNDLIVYPNPSNGILNFKYNNLLDRNNIKLFKLDGTEISYHINEVNQIVIDSKYSGWVIAKLKIDYNKEILRRIFIF